MNASQLVSVVIPSYNQARFLGEAIESVLHQSHETKEVVVVDDGSTDTTPTVASRYDVKYVRQKNAGLAGARNRGLRESSGAFVVFLDADDRLLPGALAAGLASLNDHPDCAFAYGGYQYIAADGSFVRAQEESPQDEADAYMGLLRCNHIAMLATVMYRRDALERMGGFDTSVPGGEDYELYLRIAREFPVRRHPRVVAEYRRHGSNMSDNAALMLRSIVRVLSHEEEYVRSHPQYLNAWRQGLQDSRRYYLNHLRQQVQISRHDGGPLTRRLALETTLLRYDPKGLLKARIPRLYCTWFRWSNMIRNWMTGVLAASTGTGAITATPNPIPTPADRPDGPGSTIVRWSAQGVKAVEIRVDRADGQLFSAGEPVGAAHTGHWVRDGTRFYLQDVSAADAGGAATTLAVVTVNVIPERANAGAASRPAM